MRYPAQVADIAYQNKALVYDLLFRAASETMPTIAADPKHLGARIGITAVLHTRGSAMTHHPHIHMIVPGGGIALDGSRWVSSRPAFLLLRLSAVRPGTHCRNVAPYRLRLQAVQVERRMRYCPHDHA